MESELATVEHGQATPSPWERQPGESSRAFGHFRIYRNMPATTRSLAKVGQQVGISGTRVEELSRRWNWVDRCAKWDDWLDSQRQIRLANHLDAVEKHHLTIVATALEKIVARLENLDPEDLPISQISRLLEATIRIRESVFLSPAVAQQQGQVMHARELRIHLKELGVLNAPAPEEPSPPTITPELQKWLDGDL